VHVQIQVNDTVRGALSDIPVPEGVEVVTELDEGLPPIVADAIQLNQVFGNIITNAFQAMPEGGRLLIRSRAAEGEGVAISFADTGVGIPEENLGRMFEPLFTTKARGIGLGLAAVRLLVERHGGKVEVESEPGRGSTFTVWLPVGGAALRS
jgi:signal transduction histidine kinase